MREIADLPRRRLLDAGHLDLGVARVARFGIRRAVRGGVVDANLCMRAGAGGCMCVRACVYRGMGVDMGVGVRICVCVCCTLRRMKTVKTAEGLQVTIPKDPESESEAEDGPPCRIERVAYRHGGMMVVPCASCGSAGKASAPLLVEDQKFKNCARNGRSC